MTAMLWRNTLSFSSYLIPKKIMIITRRLITIEKMVMMTGHRSYHDNVGGDNGKRV